MRDKFEVVGDAVCLPNGKKIPLRYFPCLRDEWESKNPTIPCEEKGAALVKNGFADKKAVSVFLDEVIRWTGPRGATVIEQIDHLYHSREEVIQSIQNAYNPLKSGKSEKCFKKAFDKITKPDGLSSVTGSAILRMLHPEKGAMHSKKIVEWKWGNYPDTKKGWFDILNDYEKVADELNERRIKNSERKSGKWFVADVAAAMWQWQNSFGNNGGDSAVVKE